MTSPASGTTQRVAPTNATSKFSGDTAAGLRAGALDCFLERDLDRKVEMSHRLYQRWTNREVPLQAATNPSPAPRPGDSLLPGLPVGLVLTSPTKVRRRRFGSPEGKAAFVHAIAHIEWNAINLAWDAVWRFGGMPASYYEDWARVACEEAKHFSMLRRRLNELGSEYGQLPAHNGLWETAEATSHDLLARMALVPRVLEARGLDVTPALIAKLKATGDENTAAILTVVLEEEVGHVRVGSKWFHHLCEERGVAPAEAFEAAVTRYFRGQTKPVGGEGARKLRLEAGFREDELEAIDRMAARSRPAKSHW